MTTLPNYRRVGRAGILNTLTTGMALQATPNKLAMPVATKDRDEAQIAKVAKMLGVDDADDWARIAAIQRELEARGVTDVSQLKRMLAEGDGANDDRYANGWNPPGPPKASLSPLFSDVEVLDMVKIDTVITNIPTVAISSTQTITLAQFPMKWSFTDITIDGDVAASGSSKLIELRVVLGTTVITKFRLSQLARQSAIGMVFDALQKVYAYEIGPNSSVKIEVQNMNAGAGMVFENGYFQFTYAPRIDAQSAAILRSGI